MLLTAASTVGPAAISHSSTQQQRVTQAWNLLVLHTVAKEDSAQGLPTPHPVAKCGPEKCLSCPQVIPENEWESNWHEVAWPTG